RLSVPATRAQTIMTPIGAASDVRSAIVPASVGDATPPNSSPTPTTSPIDEAASVRGTVSAGTTPMNSAKEPEPLQPISNNRLRSHSEPSKYSAASGVSRPMKVNSAMIGLRPKRADSAGTRKPQTIVAIPIGAMTKLMSLSLLPRMTVKNNGMKMRRTRYHDTMNTEMPQQIRRLRSFSMAKMPGVSPGAPGACGSGLGSRTYFQIRKAQIRPVTPVRKKA